MSMTTENELIALITNNMNNFKFTTQEINQQGSLYIDEREIMRDVSSSFGDISGAIGNYFGNSRKYLG